MAPRKRKTDSLCSRLAKRKCTRLYDCMSGYCVCYVNQRAFTEVCTCTKCSNRDSSVISTKEDGIKVINPSVKEGNRGCECRSSDCTTEFCACVVDGVACSNRCKCVRCNHTYGKIWDYTDMKKSGQEPL